MALKAIVAKKITDEILKHGDASTGTSIVWRVLIIDQFSMKMLDTCCRMDDLADYGITLVEDITKKRQPLLNLEAVYFITPTEQSVNGFLGDFSRDNVKYKSAHVFFTEACPQFLFDRICHAKISKFIKTLKEINMAFIAHESRVFTLDSPTTFRSWYGPESESEKPLACERIAEQLATVCATLGEYPSIRYSRGSCEGLAKEVQKKLDAYKAEDPTMGAGPEKARSQLLILDRSVDCISPLLHELTMQAMVYDLLPIENDIYKYQSSSSPQLKCSVLDESDNLWKDFRHQHIANVSESIKTLYNNFKESKMMISGDAKSMGDLSQMIKKMPQYQKELSKFAMHFKLIEDCLELYNSKVHKLCNAEQDLALGIDSNGEKIRNLLDKINEILLQTDITVTDKMRILSLYLTVKNGITKDNLGKLANHAEIVPKEKQTISNLNRLGINVFTDEKPKEQLNVARKNRDVKYRASRWTPVIKDIMEDVIENTVSSRASFPYLNGGRPTGAEYQVPMSARYGQFKEKSQKVLPRLIVFIVGGVCFSEIRSAYEVSAALKNWDVIIGSTHRITPEEFLNDLSTLS